MKLTWNWPKRKTDAATVKCKPCNGTGFFSEARDMHRSGGIVKCGWCNGTGRQALAAREGAE